MMSRGISTLIEKLKELRLSHYPRTGDESLPTLVLSMPENRAQIWTRTMTSFIGTLTPLQDPKAHKYCRLFSLSTSLFGELHQE